MMTSQNPMRPAAFAQQSEIGPVEIEEGNGIFWNRLDWPSYLKCPFNADLSSLIRIVQEGWCVEPPQIIVSILSDSQALSRWQNLEQIRRFQAGLVKAALSARTWIITNGLNVGAARIASEAIAAERNWQHSLIEHSLVNSKPAAFDVGRHFRRRSSEAGYDSAIIDSLEAVRNPKNHHQFEPKLQPPDDDDCGQFASSSSSPPIVQSVIVGVIDSDQIVSGPFFYKRPNDIDQPRLDLAASRHQTGQTGRPTGQLAVSCRRNETFPSSRQIIGFVF